MSNWYVRRSRERFWAKGMEQDKINAYMTLYTALVTVAKAAAPMIPFMTEDIYQNLVRSLDKNAPESIHLCDFPEVKEEWINKDLEENIIDQKCAEDQAQIQTEHVDAVTVVVKQWNKSHQKDHEKDQSQKTKLPVFPLAEKAACGYELFLQQEYQWGRA